MVRLEEVEDETFAYPPAGSKDDVLLADDDDDYTDTDSEISDTSDLQLQSDETLLDRISALKDIVPPKARAQISNVSSTVFNATSTGITYGGKGLWLLASTVLLLGIPYALALGEEQQIMEEERQRGMMQEGATGMIQSGEEGKPAL